MTDVPLSVARPPDKRIAARCNSYTLALVSMLALGCRNAY